MKKILFISIISIIFTSLTEGVTQKNDWEKMNLKGKVKSISESEYSAIVKFGAAQKINKISHCIYIFNEKGNITEESWYNNPQGTLDGKFIYTYNNKENKTERDWYNPNGTLKQKGIIRYDDKGNKISYLYNPDGTFSQNSIEKYDDKGNRIEEYYYNIDGTLKNKYTYNYDCKYDDKGNTIQDNRYDNPDRTLSAKYTYQYKYDKNANWIKQIGYTNDSLDKITEREIEYFDYVQN